MCVAKKYKFRKSKPSLHAIDTQVEKTKNSLESARDTSQPDKQHSLQTLADYFSKPAPIPSQASIAAEICMKIRIKL